MIAIIGAGPAGSYLAWKLAEAGKDVALFEEHPEVGKPVQCTGLVTNVLFDEFLPDATSCVQHELKGVTITSPSRKTITIPLHEYVLCRDALDRMIAKKAVDAGAKLFLNHHFVGYENGNAVFHNNGKTVTYKTDILVGADGPNSAVARVAGLSANREFYFSVQATVNNKDNPELFQTWFGSCAPQFFAWNVPESNNSSRLGLATKTKAKQYFDALLGSRKVLDTQAGPIPIYDPKQKAEKKTDHGTVFLTGDAATFNKSTTGGGIITGIWSSRILADCILHGKNYEKELAPLRKELWLHLKLRQALNRFSDNDYDLLVRLMDSPRIKKILNEHPREYPSQFLFKLLLAEPRLLWFGRKMI